MKFKELVTKSITELQKLLNEQRSELQQLNFQDQTGQLKQVRKIRVIKKQIAQIMTLLNKANTQDHVA